MNELYEAALEGRYHIDVDIKKEGDEFVASYKRHGLNVEVRDASQMYAMQRATEEAINGLKNVTSFDRLNG